MKLLQETLKKIEPLCNDSMIEAKEIWDSRTHPIGSLGKLEEMTIQLAGIKKKPRNELKKKGIVVMCADNGIFEEDISSSPQIFTYMLTNAMANGETGVSALSKAQGTDVFVVDIGVIPHGPYANGVINKNIREGSNNFTKKPALTKEEVIKGIEVGIEIGNDLFTNGYDILGTGELGIANTTTSSAVLAALTGLSVEESVGLGAGINEKQLKKKRKVIKDALFLHNPDPKDVIDVLSKVGGLDICGLVGVFLSGAKNRVPVVIDGIISSVAALCAKTLSPQSIHYFYASHLSKEAAAGKILEILGLSPYLMLDMRLGEGSGCPFTFTILEHALYAMNHMGTVESNQIENKVQVNIRDEKIEV